MTITFNPYMSVEIKDMVKHSVRAYIPEFKLDNFFDSFLENKIRK